MATKKVKMSLADFMQQSGGADPSNALPTAPRQRDPNDAVDASMRYSRAWKSERFNEGEGGDRRGGRGGFGEGGEGFRERRGRREEEGAEGEETGPSKADSASHWRSSNAGSDRRPRYEERGDRNDRDRDRDRDRERDRDGDARKDRDRDERPPRERENRGPTEADHASDWRAAGSSSGSRAPRSDDRRTDRDRDRSERSDRGDRGDRDRDRGDDRRRDFDRDRRRDDRDDRDRDRDSSSSSSRWGGGRDREDDRRSGGRFGRDRDDRRDDRGDFDRDRRPDSRYGRTPEDRGQRDERPAHLRFGKGRADGPSSAMSNEDFPSLKERGNRTPEPSSAASSGASASADGDKDKAKASAANALERLAKRKADATKDKDLDRENRSDAGDAEKDKDKEDKAEEEKTKKKSKKPVAASPLEAALKSSVFLTDAQFADSINWLTDEKDRLDDADQRKEIIVAVALSVLEKKLSLASVIESLDSSALSDVASTFILDVIKAIRTRRDESVALAVVKSAGQDKVLSVIAEGLDNEKLEAFLAEHDLLSLAPVPDLSESLNKAVKNGESAESLLKLIDSSVDRKANVSYLLPIVADKFLSELFADKTKANLAVVKDFSSLLARVAAFDKLAKVSFVASVVNGWFAATKGAKGVLKDVLDALLSGKVVSVEVLTDWKDSKEKGTAKMKALLQIATWISELVPKRADAEDNEEGEEEEEDDIMSNPNQSD